MRRRRKIRKALHKLVTEAPKKVNIEEALEYYEKADGRIVKRHPHVVLRLKKCARLQLSGLSMSAIARKFDVDIREVFRWIKDVAYKNYYQALEDDYFRAADHKLKLLYGETVDAMRRQLKHRDGHVVNEIIETVMKIHGKSVERVQVDHQHKYEGQVDHRHAHAHVIAEGDMTDEMRKHARAFLSLGRKQLPERTSKLTTFDEGEG